MLTWRPEIDAESPLQSLSTLFSEVTNLVGLAASMRQGSCSLCLLKSGITDTAPGRAFQILGIVLRFSCLHGKHCTPAPAPWPLAFFRIQAEPSIDHPLQREVKLPHASVTCLSVSSAPRTPGGGGR